VGDLEAGNKLDGASWKSQNDHQSVASMVTPSVTQSMPVLSTRVVRW
jgi:hypothetical protein